MTPSSRGCTPLFLRAVPTMTGVNALAMVALLMAAYKVARTYIILAISLHSTGSE